MYGEGDPYYITSGLRNAAGSNGTLYRVGAMAAKFQPVYAGNTAWAFICADRALARKSSLGGQFYYIPDDTPIQSTFNFIKPFLEIRGFKLSTFSLPYGLVYYGLLGLEWIAKLLSPIYRITLPAESYSIRYINMDLYFSREKATRELGFQPIFFPKDAIARCLSYYRDVKL
ncbi:hypothetical protein DPMN_083659 [Dreissena polymorpha]|uniref:3-beta hydroxysteroid dehydrogenase/isomerase domain-containing protein n=2 Tax=Dreissena polymorpha TaxID=45954 RepID=A0A9D3YCW1_DREPO|nr:hypothetical protein DPMN_083659 [Dreissena polymorpha]